MRFATVSATIAASVLAVVFGAASPARADALSCGREALHATMPQVTVLTCVESKGELRRAVSVVSNGSPTPVYLSTLRTLLSYPNYADRSCGPVGVAPGRTVSCTTAYVGNVPQPHSTGVAFTMIDGFDGNGGWFSRSFKHVAP